MQDSIGLEPFFRSGAGKLRGAHDAILALVLGPVEGRVGSPEQLVSGLIRLQLRDAEARGSADRVAVGDRDRDGVQRLSHSFRDSGRAEYVSATDEEALRAFRDLARTEGIIPALEPANALARARELDETHVLVCLSGRGDKDLAEVLAR